MTTEVQLWWERVSRPALELHAADLVLPGGLDAWSEIHGGSSESLDRAVAVARRIEQGRRDSQARARAYIDRMALDLFMERW